MDDEQLSIHESREKLLSFFQSKRHRFGFTIRCDISRRIEYIYQVIFPGKEKYLFYLRYLLSRIAEMIDYSPIKIILYRTIGVNIGQGVYISPKVVIDPHFPQLITIEDHAILGLGAKLFAHEQSGMRYYIGRIHIGKGAVVGAYSFIRRGVAIPAMTTVPLETVVHAKDVKHLNSKG